jgi:heme/copper-type cytochrome/quinol oxidase subunit 4
MFAAIVLLLTRELHRDPHGRIEPAIETQLIAQPVALMLGALFSLVVAAFLYAAMAGEGDKAKAGQFVEGIMPCLALSLGVVQMAVALVWLLHIRQLSGPPLELAGYVVDAAIAIVAVFLPGVFLSPIFQHLVQPRPPVDAGTVWLVMVVALLLAIPIGRLVGQLARPTLDDTDTIVQPDVLRVLNVVSVSTVVLAAVLWNVLSSTSQTDLDSLYRTPTGIVAAAAVLYLLIGILAALEAATPRDSWNIESPRRRSNPRRRGPST